MNLMDLNPQEDTLDKRAGGVGRAPTVPDEENPFLTHRWLEDTYGPEAPAKSLVVANEEAAQLRSLINRSAAKLGLGVSIQMKDNKGTRIDYVNVGTEEDKRFAYVREDGSTYGGKVRVIWKAKDRKQRKNTES